MVILNISIALCALISRGKGHNDYKSLPVRVSKKMPPSNALPRRQDLIHVVKNE
jgi:hypothetical protein